MISTRLVELVIDTVVCLTLAKCETVSGQFGGYLSEPLLIGTQLPKLVREWRYAKGEAALIFAALPDGFDRATELMNDLISEELAAQTLLVLGNAYGSPSRARYRFRPGTSCYATIANDDVNVFWECEVTGRNSSIPFCAHAQAVTGNLNEFARIRRAGPNMAQFASRIPRGYRTGEQI